MVAQRRKKKEETYFEDINFKFDTRLTIARPPKQVAINLASWHLASSRGEKGRRWSCWDSAENSRNREDLRLDRRDIRGCSRRWSRSLGFSPIEGFLPSSVDRMVDLLLPQQIATKYASKLPGQRPTSGCGSASRR
jgi:hypothetical protein